MSTDSSAPPSWAKSPPGGSSSLAASAVQALLDRAGLPRHRHSAHIGGLLDLSYHQAHRRLAGKAPWSLEELQVVASHHGETLADLFGHQASFNHERAILVAGPLRADCRLWPGQRLAHHRPGDLIALKAGAEWVVMVAGDTPTPAAYTVTRLVIEPKSNRPRRFAIVDGNVDAGQALADGLMELGFEAKAFESAALLEAALTSEIFDAYLVDWVWSGGTAEGLIAKLRNTSATCPIAVLSGPADRERLDERELVGAIEKYRLLFLQKPVTPMIAASQLNGAFGKR